MIFTICLQEDGVFTKSKCGKLHERGNEINRGNIWTNSGNFENAKARMRRGGEMANV